MPKTETLLLLLQQLLLLLPSMEVVNAAKILYYAPVSTKSMIFPIMPALEEMANRGHEIVMATSYPIEVLSNNVASQKKIKAFYPSGNLFQDYIDEICDLTLSKRMSTWELMQTDTASKTHDIIAEVNENIIMLPQMMSLLKNSSTKFDIVMVCYLGSQAGHYLAYRFNASLVHFLPLQVSHNTLDLAMGQPNNPAYQPHYLMGSINPMDFLERVKSTLMYIMSFSVMHLAQIPPMEAALDRCFPGESRPDLATLQKQASLAFDYSHPMLMDGFRAVNYNYVHIGFLHCRDPKPLPKDLEDFMQTGNEHGVILVSFGSMFTAAGMPEAKRRLMFNTFGKLKQKIVMKWESEEAPGKPDNVKLLKWVPQQDILGHKNTVLFITHSGMGGIQETIYHKKPVVSTPLSTDQFANGKYVERMGFGINILFFDLTEDKFTEAINQVLNDKKYSERVQELGSYIKEQETSPLNRTVWWLEHLIKYPGLPLLRSPVHQLTWYQYLLLDVALFFVLVLAIFMFIVYQFGKCLFFCCWKKYRGISREKKEN